MAAIHKLCGALLILPPGQDEMLIRLFVGGITIIRSDLKDVDRDTDPTWAELMGRLKAHAWLDVAMSLLPTDRAVRMHRYRGKESGWCCVSRISSVPELEITKPIPDNVELGTEFFTMCPVFPAAVLSVALKCHAVTLNVHD